MSKLSNAIDAWRNVPLRLRQLYIETSRRHLDVFESGDLRNAVEEGLRLLEAASQEEEDETCSRN